MMQLYDAQSIVGIKEQLIQANFGFRTESGEFGVSLPVSCEELESPHFTVKQFLSVNLSLF